MTKEIVENSLEKEKKVVLRTNLRQAEEYKENPFLDELTVITKPKRLTVARGAALVNQLTGEVEGTTEVAQVTMVDEEQFVKLFTKDMAIWFDLSKPAVRVFAYFMNCYQGSIGSDLVYCNPTDEKAKAFFSTTSTFYKGIAELLAKKFIARHVNQHWYFVNPTMVFNGNRARFVREIRKIPKVEAKPIQDEMRALEAAGQQRLLE